MTHERKLGLGENMIVLQESPMLDQSHTKTFEQIPYFYWQAPTYGKFNGYLIHAVYSTTTVNPNIKLLNKMREEDLIFDYYIFDIVDYDVKNMNLDFYDIEKGWRWDWEKWRNQIKTNSKENFESIVSLMKLIQRLYLLIIKIFKCGEIF